MIALLIVMEILVEMQLKMNVEYVMVQDILITVRYVMIPLKMIVFRIA